MYFLKILFCLSILLSLSEKALYGQVAINEIMASNSTTIADEDGDFEDWIELFNYSQETVDLSGFGLSDDYDRPFRWVIPEITVEPGDYLLIWASGKNRRDPNSELHTNFAISSGGEEIILTSPNGDRWDEIEPIPIPTDISLGRYPNGIGSLYFFNNPTPGYANEDEGFTDFLEPISFSIAPGFYFEDIELELYHPDENVTIYYTTDGSEPTDTRYVYEDPILLAPKSNEPNAHSMIRTNPIEADTQGFGWKQPTEAVQKAHNIRAVAIKPNYQPSKITTGTWFIDVPERDIPVISIVTPLESLFDHETGIYVPGIFYEENGYGSSIWGEPNANYFQRGIEWEREASVEWFENNSLGFQQNLGLRIHGGGTRAFPLKSFRLYARNQYGNNHIEWNVFPNEPYSAYRRLMLRNSGQDFFAVPTMLRDGFMQTLVKDLNVWTQAYRPASIFVNGEYWGLLNVRERVDRHMIERVYNVEENDLDLLTNNAEVEVGSNNHYLSMLEFIEQNGLENEDNYQHLRTLMDVDHYIDYLILNIFFRNTDWPGNNIDYWRYSGVPDPNVPEKDGRWRWLVYDLDFGFGLSGGFNSWPFNMIEFLTETENTNYANNPWATFLFRSLIENESFVEQFLSRFADLLNTTFLPQHMIDTLNIMAEEIQDEMSFHIERWGYPATIDQWENNLFLMRLFAVERPPKQWEHLIDYFDVGVKKPVGVRVNNKNLGNIFVNSIHVPFKPVGSESSTRYQWSGNYFSELPIQLRAEPITGYTFDYWQIGEEQIQNSELEIFPTDGLVIRAYFVESEVIDAFPVAHSFRDAHLYEFSNWESDETPGSFPHNMAFVYMDEQEPGLDAHPAGFTNGAYNLNSRTRINGLGAEGFSFINTGNLDGNPGYPGQRLGGAILALDTREASEVSVTWIGGTVLPNSREYRLRLQYRIGDDGPFHNFEDAEGEYVEYFRNEEADHSEIIGPILLPELLLDKPYIQLFWRYYFTGIQHDEDSGQRTELRVDNIIVEAQVDSNVPGDDESQELAFNFKLGYNYPNPFNNRTIIPFEINETGFVDINVYDITGRRVATLTNEVYSAGQHYVTFDGSMHASGVYLYIMRANGVVQNGKMMLLK